LVRGGTDIIPGTGRRDNEMIPFRTWHESSGERLAA
jgi:hypothetical protein